MYIRYRYATTPKNLALKNFRFEHGLFCTENNVVYTLPYTRTTACGQQSEIIHWSVVSRSVWCKSRRATVWKHLFTGKNDGVYIPSWGGGRRARSVTPDLSYDYDREREGGRKSAKKRGAMSLRRRKINNSAQPGRIRSYQVCRTDYSSDK